MLEILILAIGALVLLAKRTPKRRFRRYLRGNVEASLALVTLGNNTLLGAAFASVVEERTFVTSLDASWSLKDLTVVAGDGPIIVGVAHSDYSDAEIEAFVENTGGWSEGNKVAQEIAKRKIRIVGTFADFGADASALGTYVLQDGKQIHTKLNWILTTGQTVKHWAYNAGSSALTTGATLHTFGKCNLWPQ